MSSSYFFVKSSKKIDETAKMQYNYIVIKIMEVLTVKNRIPEENFDLCKYARWNKIKYPLLYALYVAFFATAFVFYVTGRHESFEPLKLWVYPVYALVILVSGWLVCMMPRYTSDVSFTGKIVSMSLTRNFDRGLSRNASTKLDEHTYLKMTCIDSNGKRRRLRIMLFADGYDGYFAEGKTIVKYKGLNYPICPESEAEGTHLCAVCGVRTYYKDGKIIHGEAQPRMAGDLIICRSCNHTLIGK